MVGVRHTVAEAFLNLYQAEILLNPACGYSTKQKVTPVQRCMASRATARFRHDGCTKRPAS